MERFPTEESCREYIVQNMLGGQVICPDCWSEHLYEYKSRPIYKCKACSKQFRLTTGTIFEGTGLSLKKWFYAIYLITDTRNLSSVELGRKLKISQKCAWNIAHKIRHAMAIKVSELNLATSLKWTNRIMAANEKVNEVEVHWVKLQYSEWLNVVRKLNCM